MHLLKRISLILVSILTLGCITVSAEEYTVPDPILYGDVDMDGEVTIKDATSIQKGIAELEYLTSVQRFLADPDKAGISIKNATDIQKCIAGLRGKWNDFFGKTVSMTLENEFSKKVSIVLNFRDDCIIVAPKSDYKYNFTLEDFPEFDFIAIEKIRGVYDPTQPSEYILYLKSPGKENVIKAIEALDYRANLDLDMVFVNSYALSDSVKGG